MNLTEWIRQNSPVVLEAGELSCFALVCERTLQTQDKLAQIVLDLRELHGAVPASVAVRVDEFMQTALCMLSNEGLEACRFLEFAVTVHDERQASRPQHRCGKADAGPRTHDSSVLRPVATIENLADALEVVSWRFRDTARMVSSCPADWDQARRVITEVVLAWVCLLHISCEALYLLRSNGDAPTDEGPLMCDTKSDRPHQGAG